ncbi:hypothetical protein SBOR_5788 [Sclerotinia borealis F-4128]|uniref:Carboxylesterase type B domain-containing protein n=1 Tax=Sclerotinia borealis (strain F-4128) TaxID=1432307 RepID=W9CAT4_SCLBF|nr:hypothetical protein SBOR_5788 [Sclerotinia borealis F-4128]
MFFPLLLLAYSSLILPTLCSPTPNKNGLVVKTTSGEIHGFINQTTPQVRQFLGVPYAEPPIGNLRFAAPQTKTKGSSINATAFPPSCMQLASNGSTIYTNVVPEFLINGGQSEDCLYLSIWAPARETNESLPVFVYIPGGGFTTGGQNSLYKIPDRWVQKTQSHIVVVMNYRVNVFGFPNAKALTEDRNPGLLDQRKAVEWVHQNIASFNGDPNRMILWGQSAGGASADSYGYAYPNNPIVKGLIIDSGSAYLLGSTDVLQTNFTALAGMVGCKDLKAEAEIGCMRNISASVIENALSSYANSGVTPKLAFTPFPDNVTAFSNGADRAARGLVAKLPAIIGSNTNEGAGFVPFSENGPGAAILNATTQSIIACPVAREVSNSTPYEYEVADTMQALWLSFANDAGKAPTVDGMTWPVYEVETKSMVVFAEGETVVQLEGGERIDGGCRF